MKKKKSKLSFDGINLLLRIPLEIQKKLGLKKGDYFVWNIHGRKICLEVEKHADNRKEKSTH